MKLNHIALPALRPAARPPSAAVPNGWLMFIAGALAATLVTSVVRGYRAEFAGPHNAAALASRRVRARRARASGTRDLVPSADRLRQALDWDELRVHCRPMVPGEGDSPFAPFYEVILRRGEGDPGLLLAGDFMQEATEQGILPDIDRWVVRRLLEWAYGDQSPENATYYIKVSGPTVRDASFAGFVATQLHMRGLADFVLCFEYDMAEALERPADAARFTRELRAEGLFARPATRPVLPPE